MQNQTARHASGFTLTEIVVALVIVGVLAAVALPAYRDQVYKSRRADAKVELNDAAQRLRRCFTDNHTFSGCLGFPLNSDEGYYQVSAVLTDGDGDGTTERFVLTAAPQGSQAADTRCGSFSLNHLGEQGVSGTDTADRCW